MKKNWILSSSIFGILFIGGLIITSVYGFDLKIATATEIIKIKFQGLEHHTNNDLIVDLKSGNLSIYEIQLMSFWYSKSFVLFNSLSKQIWSILIALITISGIAFVYSFSMIFLTDKFDFAWELVSGIIYATFAITSAILAAIIFAGWEYFVNDITLSPLYAGAKISQKYVTCIFLICFSSFPLFSYIWQLITLLRSE